MTACPTCGRELGPYARFCGSCGTPVAQQQPPIDQPQPISRPLAYPPPVAEPRPHERPVPDTQAYPPPPPPRHSAPTRSLVLPIVAGVAVLALATTGVIVFLLPRFTSQAAQPPATTSAQPAATTTSTTTTTTTTTEPTTTTTPTPPTEADLAREVAADHATAESLVGQWVPQISSKKLGLVVNGVQFGYPEIMADFTALKARFPQAIMLNSNDYNNFSGKDFWVTVQASTFGTADAANAWCDQQGFAEDDCYASRLTHTGGPAGNSKTR
ncbi:zinc ribbon domain-containing protein [Kutzneria kofuensis]|uniref:Serine/threonine-protein kinase n=1 Tax=Kutzneria kofuensis TaxID=103725 RepID=A0A7W9NKN7_9PSEU|nr:zinc ribbon domain-containing protein [Kutzneria kofuensis]MBB5895448.1 serine/threonine-protein kinase [Kutzneria kofuensis]